MAQEKKDSGDKERNGRREVEGRGDREVGLPQLLATCVCAVVLLGTFFSLITVAGLVGGFHVWVGESDEEAFLRYRQELTRQRVMRAEAEESCNEHMPPIRLLWMAPFFTRCGYGSEADSIAWGLYRYGKRHFERCVATELAKRNGDAPPPVPTDPHEMLLGRRRLALNVLHHGDSHHPEVVVETVERGMIKFNQVLNETEVPDTIVVCHSEPGAWYPPRYQTMYCPPQPADGSKPAYTIGRTMFETDRLPSGWEERLNRMDEVWVPTAFHREIFEAGGVEPAKITVIGEPVDHEFYSAERVRNAVREYERDQEGQHETDNAEKGTADWQQALQQHQEQGERTSSAMKPLDWEERVQGCIGRSGDAECGASTLEHSFRFLSILKWEKRKGWDVLLRSYLTEFTPEDSVALVILANPYHSSSDFLKPIENVVAELGMDSKDVPSVYVLHPNVPRDEMPLLYASVDAFVLASRGEGWGRPYMEAMSMGLPTIGTNFSGNTEFMLPHNSYLIDVEGMEEVGEGAFRTHKWAIPSGESLRAHMRSVMDDRALAARKGKAARRTIVRYYTEEHIARTIIKRVLEIQDVVDSRRAASDSDGDVTASGHGHTEEL